MSADVNGRDRHLAEAVHGKVEPAFRTRPPKLPRRRVEGLAQPAAVPKPASHSSPTDPVLRANPFPEVTDLICRLPLPTLFYRLEAIHLGDLLRIWVRSGTKITLSPRDFQGPTQMHRTPREARCFTGTTTLSPAKPIPGCPSLTKKRELFPGPAPTSLGSFALPHWTLPKACRSPCSGSGILTRFPFDPTRAHGMMMSFQQQQQCFDSERTSPIS